MLESVGYVDLEYSVYPGVFIAIWQGGFAFRYVGQLHIGFYCVLTSLYSYQVSHSSKQTDIKTNKQTKI